MTNMTFTATNEFIGGLQKLTANHLGRDVSERLLRLNNSVELSTEDESFLKALQNQLMKSPKFKNPEFVLRIQDKHVTLDINEWVDHALALGSLTKDQECGYPDIDNNFEVQQQCGTQLEELHKATWAKNQINSLFSYGDFNDSEEWVCDVTMPLPHIIGHMSEKTFQKVHGSVRHPYKCSLGIATLMFSFEDTSGERIDVPLLRHKKNTDINSVIDLMLPVVKDHMKGLVQAVLEQQDHLKHLPDNWPTTEVFDLAQTWASRRFLGDNGLVGSDFFDKEWTATIYEDMRNESLKVEPSENVSFLSMRQRRAAYLDSDTDSSEMTESNLVSNGGKPFRV